VPLPRAFYLRPARAVARDLLGCILMSRRAGVLTSGRIVETEAYLGPDDAASHAAFRPGSHALFYGPGGMAYVFQAYGMHYCLNAIVGDEGRPGCVLIRAIEPLEGAAVMAARRDFPADSRRLASGPGNLTRALGVTLHDNGADLTRGPLTIEARDGAAPSLISAGPRVGISRASEKILRFWVAASPYVSARRKSLPAP
jgi:DNA-3-methyladenine glycosylase